MSGKIQTQALDPTVAALGANVECHTYLPAGDFSLAAKEAFMAGKTTFVYHGTTFTLGPGHYETTRVTVTIRLGEPLPQAFADSALPLSFIAVRCPVPTTLYARPGWYHGSDHGFPAGTCQVDPVGEFADNPIICASSGSVVGLDNRQLFDAVTGLFAQVMSGQAVH